MRFPLRSGVAALLWCLTVVPLTGGAARAGEVVPPGVPGNWPSGSPDVSANGRVVAFSSQATNLVAGDINGRWDVYVRDTLARTTTLVSRGVDGGVGNGNSVNPAISSDGRFVFFTSVASNLVPGDTNERWDAFRADLKTGAIIRVSVTDAGGQRADNSFAGGISASGSTLAFQTDSGAIMLRDLPATTARFIASGYSFGALSPNGARLTFVGNRGETSDGWVWSRASGRAVPVCRGTITGGRHHGVSDIIATDAGVTCIYDAFDWTTGENWRDITTVAWPRDLSFTSRRLSYGRGETGRADVTRWGTTLADLKDTAENTTFVQVEDVTGMVARIAQVNPSVPKVSISADGSAVAYEDGGQVKLWRRSSGRIAMISIS